MLWKKQQRTPPIAYAFPSERPPLNVHGLKMGNGQSAILPARTGHQPHIGHMGRNPQAHPMMPAESMEPYAAIGGMHIAARPQEIVRRTHEAQNMQTGTAAGLRQLAPGGGLNMPPAQAAMRPPRVQNR